jgi:TRAP-type C4-dicarboxylate transport system permease small subunit
MLPAYKRFLDRVGAVEEALGVSLVLLIVVAIAVQVFTRYALGRPLAWVEESATYAFIWATFVGASVGLKRGRHILISTFVNRLPPRPAAVMRMLVWALVLATLAVLIVQGVKVFGVESRSHTISLPIELPRGWFYSLPLTLSAISMTVTAVYLFVSDLACLREGRVPRAAAAATT